MSDEVFHDSRKPVFAQPEHWGHKVGVLVDKPHKNAGLGYVEAIHWYADYPEVWTATVGGCVPLDQRYAATDKALNLVIEKIDKMVAELNQHRERMVSARDDNNRLRLESSVVLSED